VRAELLDDFLEQVAGCAVGDAIMPGSTVTSPNVVVTVRAGSNLDEERRMVDEPR
jgi:hypothetical protein